MKNATQTCELHGEDLRPRLCDECARAEEVRLEVEASAPLRFADEDLGRFTLLRSMTIDGRESLRFVETH